LHIVQAANAVALSDKKPFEYRIICPDKSVRHILIKTGDIIFDDLQNPVFLAGIAQDITEQKTTRLELIQAKNRQKLQMLLKASFSPI